MIQHRCPWCGEKIPVHIDIGPLIWRGPDLCPKCKNPCTSNTSTNSIAFMAVGLIGPYILSFFIEKLKNNNLISYYVLGIAELILLALVFIEFFRIPYARDIKKKEMLNVVPKRSVNVNLSWENHKNEGLLLPRLQVLNGEIFPACFMDAEGTQISTAFCVVLTDFFWSDSYHCACKINFVLDDAPEEDLFQKGNQFYLYHYYRKIAKGTIW